MPGSVRLAVGGKDMHSRMWGVHASPKGDVYIFGRELGGFAKVSLHSSGDCHYAMVRPGVDAGLGKGRFMEQWRRPPEFFPGLTIMFRILVPNTELRRPREPMLFEQWRRVRWIAPSRTTPVTDVQFLIVGPSEQYVGHQWPGMASTTDPTRFVAMLPLNNGERLYVVARNAPLDANIANVLNEAKRVQLTPGDPNEAVEGFMTFFSGTQEHGYWFIDAVIPEEAIVRTLPT